MLAKQFVRPTFPYSIEKIRVQMSQFTRAVLRIRYPMEEPLAFNKREEVNRQNRKLDPFNRMNRNLSSKMSFSKTKSIKLKVVNLGLSERMHMDLSLLLLTVLAMVRQTK